MLPNSNSALAIAAEPFTVAASGAPFTSVSTIGGGLAAAGSAAGPSPGPFCTRPGFRPPWAVHG